MIINIDSLIYEENSFHVGKWGMLHRKHLRENYPDFFSDMVLTGKLRTYLKSVDKEADHRYRTLIREMKESENVQDDVKPSLRPMWKTKMQKIISIAEMIVLKEIVYASPQCH